ncbi:hypothetical protein PCG10_002472 [Penicillium crustosum]|uniref:Major facilitator superfamily (MFS) profile domain-containing protein n=1 Tax=Penicillium crustosum TaxID=36656 RepID=A0A9P5GA16_PENCR|nr:uncharacterized protein N7487_005329 [Penicillium crustosum]KAF7516073.1 hypothetical protein PCG10_002472 [Penicillium crustosum]KAJ5410970.1 hypothetical protein N7487_005329 [Penicillium crustosum]
MADRNFANLSRAQNHVNVYSIVVIGFITLSSAAYGYAAANIATTLTQPSFQEDMGLVNNPNASAITGTINGIYQAGAVFGAFLAGWMSDRFGRKLTAAVGNAIIIVSGALLTGSVNPSMFIVFRLFNGLGSFIIQNSVPVWIAELAPPRIRGAVSDAHALLMLFGYCIASFVGLGFYFVPGENQWRGIVGIQMVLPTIVLCGIYWMPESPRYLLSRDRTEEAWEVVKRLHADKNDLDTHEFATREFYQMRKQIELDIRFRTSYWGIFTNTSLRKRAIMTIFLEFSIYSCGVLVILNYGSVVWASLGFDTVQILGFQVGFQSIGFVTNALSMLWVDRVPRHWFISFGLAVCAVLMAIEAALQRFYLGSTNRGGLIASATIIMLFQATFCAFLDGPTYFYITEIWPSYARSQGLALAMCTFALTNLMWLEAAPYAFEAIGWKFYTIFIVVPAIAAVIIIFTYHDTRHKPLEEIAALFGDANQVAVYQQELDRKEIPMEDMEVEPRKETAEIQEVENVVAMRT